MKTLLYNSLSPSTCSTYSSGIKSFINFCLDYKQFTAQNCILPASEETLLLFTTYLSLRVAPTTIKVYLGAVRSLHIESGLPSPINGATRLPLLLRGIKQTYGQERRKRMPITPPILLAFRRLLNLDLWDHQVLWTAMLVAFFAFLRSAELIALTTTDVTLHTNSVYILTIKASKTDPFKQGSHIRLAPSGHQYLCPVQALSQYLETRRQCHLSQSTHLFAWSCGTPMSRSALNNCIKWLAALSGINASLYATHSFRIGAATTAAAAGLPDSVIKIMGRWSSDTYQRYIHTPTSVLDSVARVMASYM